MTRLLITAALAAFATATVPAQGIPLTEMTLYHFTLGGQGYDHVTLSFPRVDVSVFGLNRTSPNPWVDYSLGSVKILGSDTGFGITGSVQSGVYTGGVWLNPCFQWGKVKASAYGYYLLDDRGGSSFFLPNARLQYCLPHATVGVEITGFGNGATWHQRLGPTISYDIDKRHTLRASLLQGSGGTELRLFAVTRF